MVKQNPSLVGTFKFQDLLELIARSYMPSPKSIKDVHDWLLQQCEQYGYPVPLRRHRPYSLRIQPGVVGGAEFWPVDNEPIVGLYALVQTDPSRVISQGSMRDLLRNLANEVPSSAHADVPSPIDGLTFRIAQPEFRRAGLKLAHLFNANRKLPPMVSANDVWCRFMRSFSPANMIPFPSHRHYSIRVSSIPIELSWWSPRKDLAEDPVIIELIRRWLGTYLKVALDASLFCPQNGGRVVCGNDHRGWSRKSEDDHFIPEEVLMNLVVSIEPK